MAAKLVLATEDRREIAERIAQISDQVLSIQDNSPSGYFSLKVGTRPHSNVVTVWKSKDRVSFFIRSTDLLNRASTAGFEPKPTEPSDNNKHKYRFEKLSLADLQNDEGLFREIVRESVGIILDRGPKRYPNG